jgi:hypothetical protein
MVLNSCYKEHSDNKDREKGRVVLACLEGKRVFRAQRVFIEPDGHQQQQREDGSVDALMLYVV